MVCFTENICRNTQHFNTSNIDNLELKGNITERDVGILNNILIHQILIENMIHSIQHVCLHHNPDDKP